VLLGEAVTHHSPGILYVTQALTHLTNN